MASAAGSGTIDVKELKAALGAMNQHPTDEELFVMIHDVSYCNKQHTLLILGGSSTCIHVAMGVAYVYVSTGCRWLGATGSERAPNEPAVHAAMSSSWSCRNDSVLLAAGQLAAPWV
jgi:hypothetical protein